MTGPTPPTPPPETELLRWEYERSGTKVNATLNRDMVRSLIDAATEHGWLAPPPVERFHDPALLRLRIDLDAHVDSGWLWSAGLPNALGLPRAYQGLLAINYNDPGAALRGLADLLDDVARRELGETLAAAQYPARSAEVRSMFDDDGARSMLSDR